MSHQNCKIKYCPGCIANWVMNTPTKERYIYIHVYIYIYAFIVRCSSICFCDLSRRIKILARLNFNTFERSYFFLKKKIFEKKKLYVVKNIWKSRPSPARPTSFCDPYISKIMRPLKKDKKISALLRSEIYQVFDTSFRGIQPIKNIFNKQTSLCKFYTSKNNKI